MSEPRRSLVGHLLAPVWTPLDRVLGRIAPVLLLVGLGLWFGGTRLNSYWMVAGGLSLALLSTLRWARDWTLRAGPPDSSS